MITVSENRAAPRHTGVQQCYARSRETPCRRVANPFLELCLWVPDVFLVLFFELVIFFRSGGSVSTSFPSAAGQGGWGSTHGWQSFPVVLGNGGTRELGTFPCCKDNAVF